MAVDMLMLPVLMSPVAVAVLVPAVLRIPVSMLLQDHIKIADIQPVFPKPLYFYLIAAYRKLRQRPA